MAKNPQRFVIMYFGAIGSSFGLDPSTRDQAFLGGLVGDMASKENLPDELLLWLLDTGNHLHLCRENYIC